MGMLALCRYIYWVYVKQRVVWFIVFGMLLSVLKLNDFLERRRNISVRIGSICGNFFYRNTLLIVFSTVKKPYKLKKFKIQSYNTKYGY